MAGLGVAGTSCCRTPTCRPTKTRVTPALSKSSISSLSPSATVESMPQTRLHSRMAERGGDAAGTGAVGHSGQRWPWPGGPRQEQQFPSEGQPALLSPNTSPQEEEQVLMDQRQGNVTLGPGYVEKASAPWNDRGRPGYRGHC